MVAAVPTTMPLSLALFETAKLRPARFGSPMMPPWNVQVNAWLPAVPIELNPQRFLHATRQNPVTQYRRHQ